MWSPGVSLLDVSPWVSSPSSPKEVLLLLPLSKLLGHLVDPLCPVQQSESVLVGRRLLGSFFTWVLCLDPRGSG